MAITVDMEEFLREGYLIVRGCVQSYSVKFLSEAAAKHAAEYCKANAGTFSDPRLEKPVVLRIRGHRSVVMRRRGNAMGELWSFARRRLDDIGLNDHSVGNFGPNLAVFKDSVVHRILF